VVIQTTVAAALAMRRFRILELVRTELLLWLLLLLFSWKKPASLLILYSVMYLTSHSRTFGSAKAWYSCTVWSTFQPDTCLMTATAQPVRCYSGYRSAVAT
jgi:hypothetical protein